LKGVKLAFDKPASMKPVLQLDPPGCPGLAELARPRHHRRVRLSRTTIPTGNALLVCAPETRSRRRHQGLADALADTLKAAVRAA
jgi:hypothetical protein